MPKMIRACLLLLTLLSASPAPAQTSLYRGYGYILWSDVPLIFAYPSQQLCEDTRNKHLTDGKLIGVCAAVEFFEQPAPAGSIVQVFVDASDRQSTDSEKIQSAAIASIGSGDDCQHLTESKCLRAWLVWNPATRTFPAAE